MGRSHKTLLTEIAQMQLPVHLEMLPLKVHLTFLHQGLKGALKTMEVGKFLRVIQCKAKSSQRFVKTMETQLAWGLFVSAHQMQGISSAAKTHIPHTKLVAARSPALLQSHGIEINTPSLHLGPDNRVKGFLMDFRPD